ncbi:MAG: hypothetical protein QW404_02325 [Candidatus Nanoarchaeia archaeon]
MDNALLAFEHFGVYHLYNVKIRPDAKIQKGRRWVDPIEFKVISHEEKDKAKFSIEQLLRELDYRISFNPDLSAMFVPDIYPIEKSLNYKLNLMVVLYVLCKQYREEYEMHIHNEPDLKS